MCLLFYLGPLYCCHPAASFACIFSIQHLQNVFESRLYFFHYKTLNTPSDSFLLNQQPPATLPPPAHSHTPYHKMSSSPPRSSLSPEPLPTASQQLSNAIRHYHQLFSLEVSSKAAYESARYWVFMSDDFLHELEWIRSKLEPHDYICRKEEIVRSYGNWADVMRVHREDWKSAWMGIKEVTARVSEGFCEHENIKY